MAFYGGLFGWDFEVRTPAGAPAAYAYARKDGLLVGGVGGPATDDQPRVGTTYVWVDSADETAVSVVAAGGQVLTPPVDIPAPAGWPCVPILLARCSGCGRRRRTAARNSSTRRDRGTSAF